MEKRPSHQWRPIEWKVIRVPELPEVEIVVRELREQITGKKILDIEAVWAKTLVNNCPVPLRGNSVLRVDRLGKYILLRLEQSVIVIHLRMTGQLLFWEKAPLERERHVRAVIHFDDGILLQFKDVRKFGRIYHVCHESEVMQNVGIDALDSRLDIVLFTEMLRGRGLGLKAFLLNQKYIAGLGNIYVDESLFKAGLSPGRSAGSLSAGEAVRLYQVIQDVLQKAIANMGSTISDYRDTRGNKGTNQKYFSVYGRYGLPCKRCGSIIKKIKMAGRGTHFCPNCQK